MFPNTKDKTIVPYDLDYKDTRNTLRPSSSILREHICVEGQVEVSWEAPVEIFDGSLEVAFKKGETIVTSLLEHCNCKICHLQAHVIR